MIRACLLDMGNVLIRFSHDKMCAQMGALCGKSAGDVRRLLIDSGLQWEFERGRVSPEEFHFQFCAAAERDHAELELAALLAAGADIFEPQPGMVELLDELKSAGQRLVLFSNTCASHVEFVRREFDFLERFDALVLSYEVQAIKPEEKMFAAARAALGHPPEECFYTDDVPEYVREARELGFDAEVFTGVEELRRQLERRGVLKQRVS
ncbi:MAG: HAD family phosphatase [Planctomycetales bacterium]